MVFYSSMPDCYAFDFENQFASENKYFAGISQQLN